MSRRCYVKTGLEILAADGPSDLKITTLCAALGTTSGSFYHHFGNFHGYTQAVVGRWETQHGNQVRALGLSDGTSRTGLLRHRSSVLALDHAVDAGMRLWAATNATVADAQQRVDELWHSALFALLYDLIAEAGTARRLAVLGRSVITGYQLVAPIRHSDELNAILLDFEQIVGTHYRTDSTQNRIDKESACRQL